MRRRNLLLTLTAVVAVGCYAAFVYGPARRHEQNLQKLRKMGVITTHAEMLAELSKGSKETARLYREAEAEYHALPDEDPSLGLWSATSEKTLADAKPVRAKLLPVILKTLRAASGDPPNWERRTVWGEDIEYPDLSGSRLLASLLVGEAGFQAAMWDHREALKALRGVYRIGEHASSEPMLVGHLIGHEVAEMHDRAALKLLERFKQDPQALAAIREHLESLPKPPSIWQALRGELYVGRTNLASTKSLQEFLDASNKNQFDPLVDWRLFRSAADRDLTAEWLKTYESFPQDADDFSGHQEVMLSSFERVGEGTTPTEKLVQMTFTYFSFADHWKRGEAARKLLLMSASLLSEHARTGRLPQDLASFGELAVDPYSGENFTYEPSQSGFRLYRPGSDPSVDGFSRSNLVCSFSW